MDEARQRVAGMGSCPRAKPGSLSGHYRAHDKIIATFDQAVREHAVVSSRYTALSTGATTTREIEPGMHRFLTATPTGRRPH